MHLAGKRALVLGGSRAIGRAVARLLAARGVRLTLPWFDWPQSAAEMIEEFGRKADGHLCRRVDCRRQDEVAALMKAVAEEMGGLDILVNNIERGGMPVLHGDYQRPVNRDQWQREMETTLLAKRLVFEEALPLLRRSPEAAVVNLSSIAALTGRAGPAGLLFSDGYSAANRGVATLTETWAKIGAPTIRVNELMLGLIEGRHGPGTRGWDLLSADQQEALRGHVLLERIGTAEEVARAVLFLIRDADYLTGTVLRLDGGYVLGGEPVTAMPEGIL